MRKIVVLSYRDIRHRKGGGATLYVHEIFKRLATAYDVTIVSTTAPNLPTRERINDMNIVRIPFPFASRFALPFSFLTKMTGGADVVIDNGDVAIPWLTPIYVRKPTISIVYQVAGNIFEYELAAPFAKIAQAAEPWVYQVYKRTKIVTCSPSTKADLVSLGISSRRVSVIRPGIDDSFRLFESDGAKFDDPTIICISRFRRYKGLNYAIAAMEYVLEKVPRAKLIIVGNGDSTELREQVSRLDYRESIQILERVPNMWNDEKRVMLSKSHLLLIPSVREGYGIVVIEANACGTPAIGFSVQGVRDSIINGKTGFLVRFGDVRELGETISKLLQEGSRDLSNLRQPAIDWARQHSWNIAAKMFAEAIELEN